MPYLSKPYKKRLFLDRIRASILNVPIPDTGNRKIDLAPWPEFICSESIVMFTENGRPEADTMRNVICKPDMLIFATGYSPHFPLLDTSYGDPFDADRRGIWRNGDESIGFIGFVRLAVGAIPPLSELQAQLWILSALGRLPKEELRDIDLKLHSCPVDESTEFWCRP